MCNGYLCKVFQTRAVDDAFFEYSALISTGQPLNFHQSVSRLFADYYNFFLFLSSKQQCSRDCRIGQGRIISTNIEHEQAHQAAPVAAAAAAVLQCNLDLVTICDLVAILQKTICQFTTYIKSLHLHYAI